MVNVTDIIMYEDGAMESWEVIRLFSELIRTGQAFELQGHYGRVAASFLRMGYILPNGDITGAGIAVYGEEEPEQYTPHYFPSGEEYPEHDYHYGAIDVEGTYPVNTAVDADLDEEEN